MCFFLADDGVDRAHDVNVQYCLVVDDDMRRLHDV